VGWVAMSERELQRVSVLGEVLSGRSTCGLKGGSLPYTLFDKEQQVSR
jgi:hypothetical protein